MWPMAPRDFAVANARQIGYDKASADAALQSLIYYYATTDAYLIAHTCALAKGLFEWLNRAWANRDTNISVLYYDVYLLPDKDDPRFAASCRKIGLPTPAEVAAASES